jgi:hypothetical protein
LSAYFVFFEPLETDLFGVVFLLCTDAFFDCADALPPFFLYQSIYLMKSPIFNGFFLIEAFAATLCLPAGVGAFLIVPFPDLSVFLPD